MGECPLLLPSQDGTAGSVPHRRGSSTTLSGQSQHTEGSQPCPFSTPDTVHLGLDVHKDSISAGILNPGHETPDVEKIIHDEESVRCLIARFPDPRLVRACYEAGPTGYDLARLLLYMGVRCEVIAPSMIPKAPGDRVKTDTRVCRRLARLHRPASWWPSASQPRPRRPCAIDAGLAPTWSRISPGPATA